MPKVDLIMRVMKQSKGFDKVLDKVKFLTADKGNCLATVPIGKDQTNVMGSLHGGFSATLVDVVSSMALVTHKYGEVPSVSVDMHLTYMKSANVGDELLIDAKTMKIGKTLAFLDVEIFNNKTKELLVKGSHIKYLIKDK